MKPAMLLFVTLAISLGSTACTTGRPQPLDRLYTPAILSEGSVYCSAVNASPSPVLMAVEILDVQGAVIPTISGVPAAPPYLPAVPTCGIMLAWYGCRVQTFVPPEAPLEARLLYCRISVPHGQKDRVRGAITSAGRNGEAR